MKIGYARVSTDDQILDLQKDALQASGCDEVYEEHASGKSRERPVLENCLRALRPGDTLCVWRLDRLGRSLSDLVDIINVLDQKGIAFVSITENIETGTPAGKLVFHVFAALAEFERNLIRERTSAGLKSARARGRVGGRPSKVTKKEVQMILALMRDPSQKPPDIALRFGIHRSTLYRIAKQNKNSNV